MEGFKGQLGANGNRADSVRAQAGLTARGTSRAGAKAEPSEPTVRIRCGWRLTDKSYPGDNRLVPPKRPERRRSSAPRCRLTTSWGWRRSQGFGCSPIKVVRELGSDRSDAKMRGVQLLSSNTLAFEPSEPALRVLVFLSYRLLMS